LIHVVPLVPPLLSSPARTAAKFSLQFPGQPGVTYLVEKTANLNPPITWQSVQTLFSTGATINAVEGSATNNALFYRLRSQ